MIFVIGLSIAGFLLSLLLLKKGKQLVDNILTLWIGLITVHLFLQYLHYTKVDYEYPHLLGLMLPLPLLHGVFLYFYSLALTGQALVPKWKYMLHFTPFFSLIILATPFYCLSAGEKLNVYQNQGKGFEWYSMIQLILILVTGFSYSLATIVEIQKHRKRIREYLSNTDRKMLRWLEYLAIGLGIIWLLVLFFEDDIIYSGVSVFILFIGFFGINQVSVFSTAVLIEKKESAQEETTIENPIEPEKYLKSGLEQQHLTSIMEALERLMETEKPFIDADLTLNQLSVRLDINPNQLSQVINSVTGNSFYHYINIYRIREFIVQASIPENKKYTFSALAFDCGFNSKTTFNKYFKLRTGKTPSAYFSS